MKIFYRVEDGQFVGFDKFQEGNNAAAIDFFNVSRSLTPKVRKINYDIEPYKNQLKSVKKLLDERFINIPRYSFSSDKVIAWINSIAFENQIPRIKIEALFERLSLFGIKSIDEILRHESYRSWRKGVPPSNSIPEVLEFYQLMGLIIKSFWIKKP